jgi:hypothetical protein
MFLIRQHDTSSVSSASCDGRKGGLPLHDERRAAFALGCFEAAVPENLIKQWMGHSQNLIDLYAAQLRLDVAYRRDGAGELVGDLRWANVAIRPSLVAQTILRQAT